MNILDNLDTIPDNSDFIGKKFQHLTVIARGPNYISPKGHKQSQWWCQCDCEEQNIILVRRNNLTSNNTKSCGCQNNSARRENIQKAHEINTLDLTNEIFGELKALFPTDRRNNGSVVWKCACSCGKEHFVSAHDLKHKRIESCGHTTDSKGVRKIKSILDSNNIIYEIEKTFENCRFKDTYMLARFDFFVNDSYLIEYDGKQHFQWSSYGWDNKQNFNKIVEHDKFKNDWCLFNEIPLIRIPYTHFNNIKIEDLILETTKFRVT